MQDRTDESFSFPTAEPSTAAIADPLTDVLRRGAQQLLIDAIEAEVAAWIDDRQLITDANGHRQVVRKALIRNAFAWRCLPDFPVVERYRCRSGQFLCH